MRPVTRGASPHPTDFTDYRDAFVPLVGRIGSYCSYCERYIATNLAVEHIQPKKLKRPDGSLPYAHLEGRWTNFLLGCVNCNSAKGDQDVDLAAVTLPDRDNTFAAFVYRADGTVAPAPGAPSGAAELIRLTGLDRTVRHAYDDNGKLIATDRTSQRMEIWDIAQRNLYRWRQSPTPALQGAIVDLAVASGFFSIWMTVFADEPVVRRALLDAHRGTAHDCFDSATTAPIAPRPIDPTTGLVDGLPHGGKV